MHKVGDLLGNLIPKGPRSGASDARAASTSAAGTQPAQPTPTVGPSAGPSAQPAPAASPTPQTNHYPPLPERHRRTGPRSELTLIKGVLSKVLAKKGLDKKVERYGFILYWTEIVGEQLAHVSQPECISRRALVVRVSHSTWAQELAFMKPVLLAKLANYLMPGDIVDDMIFRVGLLDP